MSLTSLTLDDGLNCAFRFCRTMKRYEEEFRGGPSVCARARTHTHTLTHRYWYYDLSWVPDIYIYIYACLTVSKSVPVAGSEDLVFFLCICHHPFLFFFWGSQISAPCTYVCSVQNCTLPYWFYLQHIGSHNDSEFVVSSIITNIIRYLSRSYDQVYWKPQYWLHIGSISSSCLSKPSYNGTFMAKI